PKRHELICDMSHLVTAWLLSVLNVF
ncbi:XRE family transcriptional regulator, partial [Shigella flexneri]|nr:XRE family transcriptional regulator [Shigella flexneri]EFV9905158.1 XRE family transcriptional regulator [Shigella flexneri]EFW6746077.1 XRE family transcriptional regulator [Shigella flexneri]EFX8863018.1 XRE family transcriptional regulator [Shigella flexneri]EFX9491274.1 XRE family transcriptional regulator [Shigella flexneri]